MWIEPARIMLDEMGLAPGFREFLRPDEGSAGGSTGFSGGVADRLAATTAIIKETIDNYPIEVDQAIDYLAGWMHDRAPVRILGAGRARLAAAIPANRLAHGGARVYLQDSEVPMPHTLNGGGILAASASGKTSTVLHALSQAKSRNRDIVAIGLAAAEAHAFAELCTIFVGMAPARSDANRGLSALADLEEFAISQILDCMVVCAGRKLGYTDATWRLGHEDLGATGPYDYGQPR